MHPVQHPHTCFSSTQYFCPVTEGMIQASLQIMWQHVLFCASFNPVAGYNTWKQQYKKGEVMKLGDKKLPFQLWICRSHGSFTVKDKTQNTVYCWQCYRSRTDIQNTCFQKYIKLRHLKLIATLPLNWIKLSIKIMIYPSLYPTMIQP